MAKGFNADEINLGNFEGIKLYRRISAPLHAVQLNYEEGWFVTTSEGRERGKPGDYMVISAEGRKVVDRDEFEDNFSEVKE